MTQHSIGPKLESDRPRHDTRRIERPWDLLVHVTYLEIDQKAQARRGTPVPGMCDCGSDRTREPR